jgi:hypothetical protein
MFHSKTEIDCLPATTGDFRSSRSWMEVLAVTTLLLLTVPVKRKTTMTKLEIVYSAHVKRVIKLTYSY